MEPQPTRTWVTPAFAVERLEDFDAKAGSCIQNYSVNAFCTGKGENGCDPCSY